MSYTRLSKTIFPHRDGDSWGVGLLKNVIVLFHPDNALMAKTIILDCNFCVITPSLLSARSLNCIFNTVDNKVLYIWV